MFLEPSKIWQISRTSIFAAKKHIFQVPELGRRVVGEPRGEDPAGRRLGAPDADRRDELPARVLANGRQRGSASFETPLIGSLILIRYP